MDFYSNLMVSQTPPFCSQPPHPPHPHLHHHVHPYSHVVPPGYPDHHPVPPPYHHNPYAAYYASSFQQTPAPPYGPPSNQEIRAPVATVYNTKTERPPSATGKDAFWDINDKCLPKVVSPDAFELWPQGHCQHVYRKGSSDYVKKHASGWAMRNTNNHNKLILKKSCIGVLVCTAPECNTVQRPAICDKVRRSQEGRACPRKGCNGRIKLWPCRGHGSYPVTHFWRQVGDLVYFQAKGCHDHVRPELKAVRNKPSRVKQASGGSCGGNTNSSGHSNATTTTATTAATASTEACPCDQPTEKSSNSTDPYPGMYDAPYGVAQTVATVAVASYTHFPMPTPYKPPFVKPESHSSHPAYHPNAHATGAGSPWTTASPPGARHPHLPFHPCPPSAGPVSEDVYVGYKQTPSLSHIWPYQAGHSSSTPMRPYELFSQPPRAVIPFNLNGSSFRSSSGTSNTSSSGGERRLS